MKLYKYKSLASSLENALDMITNERLYCSSWKQLNDPMEGVFSYSHPIGSKTSLNINKKLSSIRFQKERLRICSLSEVGNEYEAYLMWAHYANGFNGIALELFLDESEVFPVTYVTGFPHFNIIASDSDDQYAKKVLSYKMNCWSYERERRIITNNEFYSIQGKLTKVIIGFRAKSNTIDIIKTLCTAKNIPVYTTGLGDEGVDFDRLQ